MIMILSNDGTNSFIAITATIVHYMYHMYHMYHTEQLDKSYNNLRTDSK